jgi:hypothetical protein
MKINSFVILSLLSLASNAVARRGSRFRAYDDQVPVQEKSRVTAFINTDEGMKVECWEIEDLLPSDRSKGAVRGLQMAGRFSVTLFTFPPSFDIIRNGETGAHKDTVDFRSKPNLFTVKDGLVFVEATPISGSDSPMPERPDNYVFSLENGDDWFYFEDNTYSHDVNNNVQGTCSRSIPNDPFSIRTISGSDTTLISFEYERTPKHRVVHEGRCKFAGLKPLSQPGQSEWDSGDFRVQNLDL